MEAETMYDARQMAVSGEVLWASAETVNRMLTMRNVFDVRRCSNSFGAQREKTTRATRRVAKKARALVCDVVRNASRMGRLVREGMRELPTLSRSSRRPSNCAHAPLLQPTIPLLNSAFFRIFALTEGDIYILGALE